MIYVCVVAQNHAPTAGLLLWKIRQVFMLHPREYQFLVLDDGSADGTAELLEPYQRALPMTLVRHETPAGYAASVARLFREALHRTDRPKRDAALLIPADFGVSPEVIPGLLKGIDSGADVVVGEAMDAPTSVTARLVRRSAPWLLRPGVRVPGVRDLISGCCALRLITIKHWLDEREARPLESEGISARAELLARAAEGARQLATVPVPPRAVPDAAPARALALALDLFRTGRRVRVPATTATLLRIGT